MALLRIWIFRWCVSFLFARRICAENIAKRSPLVETADADDDDMCDVVSLAQRVLDVRPLSFKRQRQDHMTCQEIKFQEDCRTSKDRFGIQCAGWSGKVCHAEAPTCSAITDPKICRQSRRLLNVSCAGWGGLSCLAHGAPATLITTPSLCENSYKLFGIPSLGWGGHACLAVATCEELTTPVLCSRAKHKFNISCVGWGGSTCLPPDSLASAITNRRICDQAEKRLGIKNLGWGGSTCLSTKPNCEDVTDPWLCKRTRHQLGVSCAGWGGSSCLPRDAPATAITSMEICAQSLRFLKIPSLGWGGKRCLPNKTPQCSDLETADVCGESYLRFNVSCAGWNRKTGRCVPPPGREGSNSLGGGPAGAVRLAAPALAPIDVGMEREVGRKWVMGFTDPSQEASVGAFNALDSGPVSAEAASMLQVGVSTMSTFDTEVADAGAGDSRGRDHGDWPNIEGIRGRAPLIGRMGRDPFKDEGHGSLQEQVDKAMAKGTTPRPKSEAAHDHLGITLVIIVAVLAVFIGLPVLYAIWICVTLSFDVRPARRDFECRKQDEVNNHQDAAQGDTP